MNTVDARRTLAKQRAAPRRRRAFAKKLNDAPLAIVDKRRSAHNVSEVMNLIGDVKGKVAVLVDDMIDTAGTITNAAKVGFYYGIIRATSCRKLVAAGGGGHQPDTWCSTASQIAQAGGPLRQAVRSHVRAVATTHCCACQHPSSR